jgi:prophage regulatory protein
MKPERILRETEVRLRSGLSRTTRWRLIQSGQFPAAIKLSAHAVGWRESDIQSWIEHRLQTGLKKLSNKSAES